MLQQLFNSVDTAVVGRFASSEALAAVGSNGSLISLMINLFIGISLGANVVIAKYMVRSRTSEGEQRAYNPEFKHTTYYKIYNDLINNKKLIDTAKRTGYKIKYVLHPILSSQVNDFIPDPYVEVVSSVGDFNYETAFQESSLMVTDYSGVQFDFAYMKKPLVYFHPSQLPAHYDDGGFFYDTMGFGEICTESDQLVDLLCEYMENGCKMKPKYVERVEDFYQFDDHNNCERIYNEIIKYQQQVNKDKLK